ncbi:hypothetical protein DVT68_16260 [Dyella solisilvae]|uniref:Uncharacterized protein n=1 Tax=Dyella solisilvae TaxID=1920168 RepID=A0A370K4H0_9GAMM|nr:hypothetical protein DVT68_16260 [Dyella solisilvae]
MAQGGPPTINEPSWSDGGVRMPYIRKLTGRSRCVIHESGRKHGLRNGGSPELFNWAHSKSGFHYRMSASVSSEYQAA